MKSQTSCGMSKTSRGICFVVGAILVVLLSTVLSRRNRETAINSYNRGVEAVQENDYDLAITCFSEAIRLAPQLAIAYNSRGFAYDKKGEYDKAIADYTEAIRLDPKDAMAYGNRAHAHLNKGDYAKAIADLRRAIRLNPDCAHLYCGWVVACGAARHLDVKKDNDMQRGRPRAVYAGILLMIGMLVGLSTIAVVALAGH